MDGGGINVKGVQCTLADLHGHFDRRGVALGDYAHVGHVADGDAFQRHRARRLLGPRHSQSRSADELAGKQPSRGAGHEKDEPDQHGRGRQHQRSHPQLRPLNLFAAWHGTPLAESMQADALRIAERAEFRPVFENHAGHGKIGCVSNGKRGAGHSQAGGNLGGSAMKPEAWACRWAARTTSISSQLTP